MKYAKAILYLILFLWTGGCEKISYSVDNPFAGFPTRVLMHKGSGDNPDFKGNTLAAAEYGLCLFDGIELDIQISKDGTLWLDHDNEVHDCEGNVIGCFQTMTDSEILAAAECNDTIRYETLEAVFEMMSVKYPNSIISLDIKGQYCEVTNTPETMEKMALSVIDLVTKYKMEHKVIVESSSIEFLEELDNQAIIGNFIITVSGDVDEAIANAGITKARGISLKYGVEEYNSEVVSLIHKKGYAIMIWYINTPEDINAVWNTGTDFIQTDNPDFKKYIPE
jgi:glycerophosphoryl diester phosphodiesterase